MLTDEVVSVLSVAIFSVDQQAGESVWTEYVKDWLALPLIAELILSKIHSLSQNLIRR